LLASFEEATSSFSFNWTASDSLFCDLCIKKTIKNVTIVVPVFITSCHVSENLNRGPEIIQSIIIKKAVEKQPEAS
jgi:hypothetical protein